MKNILLGIIATCLILITGKMYLGDMQTANAASDVQKVVICDKSGNRCAEVYSGTLSTT